ncbi:MAG TPA: hypothetical protein VFA26_19710 [Gemmataceae bacterium]|nr:hypothetical protein [Gemmataceae bacterium]
MPETIGCPRCGRKLRLPNEVIGCLVQCPRCAETFTASLPAPGPPPAPVWAAEQESRAETAPPPPPASRGDREGVDFYLHRDGRDAERLTAPDEGNELPPSAARRWDHGVRMRAAEQVGGPATALIVTGVLNVVVSLIVLVVAAAVGGMDTSRGRPDGEGELISGVARGGVGIVLGALITIGAVRMKRLESHGWGLASAILALIPCTPCCLLGLPVGIWALVALNRPEVKDAFR